MDLVSFVREHDTREAFQASRGKRKPWVPLSLSFEFGDLIALVFPQAGVVPLQTNEMLM